VLAAAALFLVVGACGCRRDAASEFQARPVVDAADFTKTAAAWNAPNRQRLFIGLGSNGLFLGPGGDCSPPADDLPFSSMPVVFGDLWARSHRVSALALSLIPQPILDDSYRQVLDIDTGLTTTWWRYRSSLLHSGKCQVETIVTPEGVCCWRIRTTGPDLVLRVSAPDIGLNDWKFVGDTATARISTDESVGAVRLRVSPPPRWELRKDASGQAQIIAGLGTDTFVALAQQASPAGGSSAEYPTAETRYRSFDDAACAAAAFWKDFWSRSEVDIPDTELIKWYRRALYYLAAVSADAAYPPGPMGAAPVRWGGRIFGHDTTYMHYALLVSNYPDIARRYVEWYLQVLPAAREHAAAKYNLPGARYGWEQNGRGEEACEALYADEHHVNADIAWQAYMQAAWTGDDELAEQIKPLLRETGTFLAALLKWDEDLDGFVSPPVTDLDENAGRIRGAISTQLAAAWLAEACHELGTATPETERIRGRVYLPRTDTESGPVLVAYPGDTLKRPMKHPSPLLGIWWLPVLDPRSDLVRRTFDATLERIDLDKTPTFNRPWLAAVAARMHDGERAHRLLTDLLVAPGAIVDDTCFAETQGTRWTHFITTCGALVSAVNEMLLQSHEEDQIDIFPAVPEAWLKSKMSFSNLLARGGVLVSAMWSPDRVNIILTGGPAPQRMRLSLPARPRGGRWRAFVDGAPLVLKCIEPGRLEMTLELAARAKCSVVVRRQGA